MHEKLLCCVCMEARATYVCVLFLGNLYILKCAQVGKTRLPISFFLFLDTFLKQGICVKTHLADHNFINKIL